MTERPTLEVKHSTILLVTFLNLSKKAKYEKQIFLNIHGHSHEGDGFKRFGGCVVYNPGSLGKHDQFGRITLKRDQKGKWAAKGFEFMTVEDITFD
jgi:predicted phosphodiesterase